MAKTCVDKNVKIISTISQSVLILKMYEKKFDDTKGAIRSCLKRIDNTMAKGKGQKDKQ